MIIDASALLALLQGEVGANQVLDALAQGAICAANLSEAVGKFIQHGVPISEITSVLSSLDLEIVPVDEDIALLAGSLITQGQPLGLSLGDRLCLATGIAHSKAVLTADKVWQEFQHPDVRVQLIR